MNDRELLDLAARAAGITGVYHSMGEGMRIETNLGHDWWNPLEDDGDALRLAVNLRLDIEHFSGKSVRSMDFSYTGLGDEQEYGGDDYAATRRAITRAAAEIGRTMK